MIRKMTKKEKILYSNYGRRWDIIVRYKITLSRDDTVNILKCHEKMINLGCVMIKRYTRKIRLFNYYIYLNKLFGGIEK